MAVSSNSNVLALRALSQLNSAGNALQKNLQRLSSGMRINTASDDAAGLAVSAGLNVQSRVYGQAIRNVNDGISALAIAQGGLDNLNSIVQRQLELANQAANGSLSAAQRRSLDREANQLVTEYNRIVQTTSFNGTNLLSSPTSALSIQQGFGSRGMLNLNINNNPGSTTAGTTKGGNFSFQKSLTVNNTVSDLEGGDLNNDGYDEVVVAGNSGSFNGLDVYWNDGLGNLSAVNVTSTDAYSHVKIQDMNGDGAMDIVALNSTKNTIDVFYNAGGQGFKSYSYSGLSGNTLTDFALGDIDKDGMVDIYGLTNVSDVEMITIGTDLEVLAQDSISIKDNYGIMGAVSIASGNLDGDGFADVIVSGGGGIFAFAPTSTLINGVSHYDLTNTQIFGSGGDGMLTLRDMDADGQADLLVTGSASDTGFYKGLGNGTFAAKVAFADKSGVLGALSLAGAQLEIADMNGDGLLDFVNTNGSTTIYFGDGSGYFVNSSLAIGAADMTALVDMNGDGRKDLWLGRPTNYSIDLYLQYTTTSGGTSTPGQSLIQAALDLTTAGRARTALDDLYNMQALLSKSMNNVGASQSRLATSLSVLQSTKIGYDSAKAQILDADTALEAANMVKNQIRQQTAASVLAQATQQPTIVLKLLSF